MRLCVCVCVCVRVGISGRRETRREIKKGSSKARVTLLSRDITQWRVEETLGDLHSPKRGCRAAEVRSVLLRAAG